MENKLYLSQSLKIIKYIVKDIQWIALLRSPKWFWLIHFPFIAVCLLQALYKERSKNLYFNHKIYDGLTRNDFIMSDLLVFLCKLKIIKKPSENHDPYSMGYFIGYQEDEQES